MMMANFRHKGMAVSDHSYEIVPELTIRQLNFLSRRLGCFSGRTLLDVSADSSEWVLQTKQRGGAISGIINNGNEIDECVSKTAPQSAIKHSAHSLHRILIRDHQLFAHPHVTPETTIAIANLLSCLKSRGRVVIPISDVDKSLRLWTRRFEGFPGTLIKRELATGLIDYLTGTFLLRGIHKIPVLEYSIGKKLLSRLQWHQLAREAVLNRVDTSSAAA